MTGNGQLLNHDELKCIGQGPGRSSAQGKVNTSLLEVPSLSTDQFKSEGAESAGAACHVQSSPPSQDLAMTSSVLPCRAWG